MKRLLLKGLTFYQRFLSPFLSLYFGLNCRYYPSCSEYAKLALEGHGLLKGGFLSLKRFLKCNPLFAGGIDLPPEPKEKKEKRHG